MTIWIGALPPQQEATLTFKLVKILGIQNGAYNFSLPVSFYPDYSRHGIERGQIVYDFQYLISIKAAAILTHLNKPKNSECSLTDGGKGAVISCRVPDRVLAVQYKT